MSQQDSTQMAILYDAKTMRLSWRITKGRIQTSIRKL